MFLPKSGFHVAIMRAILQPQAVPGGNKKSFRSKELKALPTNCKGQVCSVKRKPPNFGNDPFGPANSWAESRAHCGLLVPPGPKRKLGPSGYSGPSFAVHCWMESLFCVCIQAQSYSLPTCTQETWGSNGR